MSGNPSLSAVLIASLLVGLPELSAQQIFAKAILAPVAAGSLPLPSNPVTSPLALLTPQPTLDAAVTNPLVSPTNFALRQPWPPPPAVQRQRNRHKIIAFSVLIATILILVIVYAGQRD